MKYWLSVILLIVLMGCQAPEVTVGKKKVPDPLSVTGDVVEYWARGADWLKQDYLDGHPEPEEGTEVAVALSDAIGPPEKPREDPDKVIADLQKSIRILKAQLAIKNGFLERYRGMPVEGTGVNLLGWMDSYWFWYSLIALTILLGGGPIVIYVIRSFVGLVMSFVRAIELLRQEDPELVARYETAAGRTMDKKHKKYILKAKKWLFKKEPELANMTKKIRWENPPPPPEGAVPPSYTRNPVR